MRNPAFAHLSDETLLRELRAHLASERSETSVVLAYLAEVDARRLYAVHGYPSMYRFCVHELHLEEQAAYKRIRAARAARRFPVLLTAVADGRLHLSAVVLLRPHLTKATVDELVAAATHRSKAEIEQWLARRFPQADVPARVREVPTGALVSASPVPGPVEQATSACGELQLSPGTVATQDCPTAESRCDRSTVKPLAPQRFVLQLTIGQTAHDKLRYAQELLSHQLPSGDIAEVFERALDALIPKLEKRKFAATDKPRKGASCSEPGSRYIPAQVKRAVWKRDGGQCTFVSGSGHRCEARKFLEFDHVDPVGRGGRASVSGIRLRCRAHNQLEAERTYGEAFMENKRRAAEARAAVRAQAEAAARAKAAAKEVVPWLRKLGFHAGEARQAAVLCADIAGASLEERVRRALASLGPPARSAPA